VRNVLLAFRGEGFLIAGAAAEGDDNDFSFGDCGGVEQAAGAKNRRTEREAGGGAQEIAAGSRELRG
jgi:hypothetical protein